MGSRPSVPRLKLAWNGTYDTDSRTLYCGYGAGFFEMCSAALWNLREVQAACSELPVRVDFSCGFSYCRDEAPGAQQEDLYPLLFQLAPGGLPRVRLPMVGPNDLYAFLDHERINPVIRHYFHPSDRALNVQAALLQRYRIDPSRTIAVVIGGDDPRAEGRGVQPEACLRLARQLLMRNPEHRLWIQAKERAVRDLFCEAFGERCFFLHEMAVDSDGHWPQGQAGNKSALPRGDFGVLLIAVSHLLAQCDLVVNHTGSSALWLCLFRGHGRGVWQIDDEGHAINPHRPGAWFGAARRAWIRLRRRVRRNAQAPGGR